MRHKIKIVRQADPLLRGLILDLGVNVFFVSKHTERYSVDMPEEDGLKRIRSLVVVIPPGSEAVQ